MSTEVANQISTLSDRISRQKEEDFKKMVQTTMPPDVFSGMAFLDHKTQSLAAEGPGVLTTGLSATAAENFLTCRVYSLDGHHDGIDNPLSVKTELEYETAINASFNGAIRLDHQELASLTNGSVWKCTLKGGMVTLDAVEQRTSFVFNPNKRAELVNQGPSTSAQSAHQGGGKQPQIEYKRPENTRVELRFKSNSLKTQAGQTQYKIFFDTFVTRLSLTNFSNTFVQVNSLKRTPSSQAAAMVSSRFGNGKSLENFRGWFKNTYKSYGTKGTAANGCWQIIKKSWTSPQGLRTALTAEIQRQVTRGQYISKHLRAGAIDLNTNVQTFNDVKIMLEVAKEMKPYIVSFYNWEGVSDKAGGENKRKTQGVYNYNEHLHLNLTNTGTGGE